MCVYNEKKNWCVNVKKCFKLWVSKQSSVSVFNATFFCAAIFVPWKWKWYVHTYIHTYLICVLVFIHSYKQTYKEFNWKKNHFVSDRRPVVRKPSNFQRFNVDTLLYYVEMFIHKYIRTFNIDDGITHKSAHAYTNNTNTGKPHARTFARTTYVEANEYVRMYVYLSVCLGT